MPCLLKILTEETKTKRYHRRSRTPVVSGFVASLNGNVNLTKQTGSQATAFSADEMIGTRTGSVKISKVCRSCQRDVIENASNAARAMEPFVKPSAIRSRVSAQTMVLIVPDLMLSFNCSKSMIKLCSVGITVSSQRKESNKLLQSVTSWMQNGRDPDSST